MLDQLIVSKSLERLNDAKLRRVISGLHYHVAIIPREIYHTRSTHNRRLCIARA